MRTELNNEWNVLAFFGGEEEESDAIVCDAFDVNVIHVFRCFAVLRTKTCDSSER